MNFVTDLDDFRVERVAAREEGVFMSDVLYQLEDGADGLIILCGVVSEEDH